MLGSHLITQLKIIDNFEDSFVAIFTLSLFIRSLANVLLQTPSTGLSANSPSGDKKEPKLYGLTSYMNQSHIRILFSCLDFSYEKAISFDSRPGLKFLLQKVAGLEKATNLYKQAGACWTLKIIALFELYLFESQKCKVSLDKVKDHMEKFDLKWVPTVYMITNVI